MINLFVEQDTARRSKLFKKTSQFVRKSKGESPQKRYSNFELSLNPNAKEELTEPLSDYF